MASRSRQRGGKWSPAVGKAIKVVIDDRGISQAALGRMTDISYSQMSKYLHGYRTMNLDELEVICEKLHLDIVDVMIEADEATRG